MHKTFPFWNIQQRYVTVRTHYQRFSAPADSQVIASPGPVAAPPRLAPDNPGCRWAAVPVREPSMHRCLRGICGTNPRRRYGYLHKSGRHVIDEAGDEPVCRQ